MFSTITPEQAGISARHVEQFLRTLEKRGLATHSVLLMRGNDIFAEYYWKPFHKDFCHRMYSQTKSYVGVAVGLLLDDGKVDLDDSICKYFPEKIDRELPEYLQGQTIRDMLTMQTCGCPPDWFTHEDPDRTHLYFNENPAAIPGGMRWAYDSAGSQVLGALVEKLSGMSLFDYMYERIFRHLGTFQNASILKTRNGDSWGDSALLCTPRDMASFARFVMNYGKWEGKQLMSEQYLRDATAPLVSNDKLGFHSYETRGYGYQIWALDDEGFFFNGMGCQLTFCLPGKDLIFTINSDNQGFPDAKSLIYTAFRDIIVDNLQDAPLPEDLASVRSLRDYGDSLKLLAITGHKPELFAKFSKELHDKVWLCAPHKSGITKFSLHFTSEDEGELRYTNAQGDKVLPFGFGKNVFCKFPHEGYSTDRGGLRNTEGYLYDCAVSGAWREERKLELKVQIIDRYFGNALFTIGFDCQDAVLMMRRHAEDFLETYAGAVAAKLQA